MRGSAHLLALLCAAVLATDGACGDDSAPASKTAPQPATAAPPADAAATRVAGTEVSLRVLGMTWAETWPRRVRAALESVPGVRVIEVSFSQQLAVVRYDDATATIADMVAAVEALGYRAWDAATEKRSAGSPTR